MNKTAEQFDNDMDAAITKLVDEMRPLFKSFYEQVEMIAGEMKQSDIPDHFKLAIFEKGLKGLETAIDALGEEFS